MNPMSACERERDSELDNNNKRMDMCVCVYQCRPLSRISLTITLPNLSQIS